ncbi:hypothetical protein OGATHE_002796 [Ogataea polymorpha]|uniref:Uncharacterized protein n=1 Tax=Ogataea polymorpha TaxID=460523 RepID=A0A9P8PCZ3_9ASCO|nr:hypothetical protein OGATHE_002796 [Ogataea polymorpha]
MVAKMLIPTATVPPRAAEAHLEEASDTVEVGDNVQPGSDFLISFEENVAPFDLTQFEVSLLGWEIDQSGTILQNNSRNTFWVPEKLVDIVIANDAVVVLFTLDIAAINNLINLSSDEAVKRGNDSVEVVALWNRVSSLSACFRVQIILSTFVNEAQTL